MVTDITDQSFEDEVLKSNLPVFACFTTSQCRSCFAPSLLTKDLAEECEGRIKFVRVDVEKEPELAARYRIIPLPTVLLFQGPEPVKNLLGFQYKGSLRDLMDSLIARSDQFA